MLQSLWSGLEVPETQESTAIDFSTDACLKRKRKGAKEIQKSKHKLKIINIYLNINNLVIIRPDFTVFLAHKWTHWHITGNIKHNEHNPY